MRGRRRALDPSAPFSGGDPNYVGLALGAASRTLNDFKVALATALVHGVLNGGSPDAGAVGDLIDRQLANSLSFDLACDNAEHGALALGVEMTHRIGKRARTAKQPLAIATLEAFLIG
jgi:hypothetical protein